jgi:protein TonB
MKKILLLSLVFVFVQIAKAQDIEIPAEATVYKDSVVDVQPEFPGGIDNFYKYFQSQFKKPGVHGIVDKVVLSFIVETDGSLTDIRIVHDAGFGTADQVLTIVGQGPKWKPGSKDGKPVRVFHLLPIAIVTEE